MRANSNVVTCGLFIFILSLCLMAGCGVKHDQTKEISSLTLSQQKTSAHGVISAAELKRIEKGGNVSIVDDSCAGVAWTPKNKKNIFSKVIVWLKSAKAYKGVVPKSTSSRIINANTNPSSLCIYTFDKHSLGISPAYYISKSDIARRNHFIPDVLKLTCDKQSTYIISKELFDWLKNDKWKTEFKMM